jgi:dsDNA-binding SOS-regulon protein
MAGVSKQEADAYDRMLDAAGELVNLIESGGFALDELVLEELSVFLARNGPEVRRILKPAAKMWG